MGLFDFLKSKKKEETNNIEMKSDSIECDGIEITLHTEQTQQNEISLNLVGEDNTTAINQAVHKAIDKQDVELYSATGGKLYQEQPDLEQPKPLTEQEAITIQQALSKAIELSTPKTENIEQQSEQQEMTEQTEQIEQIEQAEQTEQQQNTEENKQSKKGFFAKLKEGLDKTRKNIMGGVDNVLGAFTKIDEDLFEELEEALIMADLGVETTMNIIENLRKRVKKEHIVDPQAIRGMLIEEITAILEEDAQEEKELPSPTVMLVIGVNGGKNNNNRKISI